MTSVQDRFLSAFYDRSGPDEDFYLSGGTALAAFHLHHRYSDDLDFFTRTQESLASADERVAVAARATGLEIAGISRSSHYVRYDLTGDATHEHPLRKVEAIHDQPPYFASPERHGNVLVDPVLNIAVNKVTAMSPDRAKDYFDLYLIVQSGRLRLEDVLPLVPQKDPGMVPAVIAGQFAQVERLPDLGEFQKGYMIAAVDPASMVRFYMDWAVRLFGL